MTDSGPLTTDTQQEDSVVNNRLANLHVLKNEELADYVPADLLERYEVYSFRHAAEILSTTCKAELVNC